MKHKEVAAIFAEIADLLEITGEQSFRVNSYRKASRVLQAMTEDLEAMAAAGRIQELAGIGKSMAAKITEYLSTSQMAMHVELRAGVPASLLPLLNIPGMGPKKIAMVWKELRIESLGDLKKAIEGGTLAKLKGFGEKSVLQISQGLAFAEKISDRTPLGLAWPLAEELAEAMRKVRGVKQVAIAGSLRRGSETVGDLDLLCEAENDAEVVAAFTKLPQVKRILAAGDTKGSVLVDRRDGVEMQADCRVVPAESFGAALQYFTGSKEHNVRLREMAVKKKWKLNEWGLFDGEKSLAGRKEEDIYKKLGLAFVPPEQREDRGEFESGAIEPLIKLEDIRGDLHMHTTASDGTVDASEMAAAAIERGYEYIAITDHSKSSAIANGLSIDRMWRQIEKIRALNKEMDSLAVLIGCECDILPDGTLDYPDAILAACDWVVASSHSSLRQERSKAMSRVLAAMENPYVTMIGHPTGRLINRREPMDLDMAEIVAQAAKTGTALEINASWQRLDLCDRHARMARDAGVKMCIDTDSHAPAQMDQMKFGIATARRGWVRPKDVLNTLPLTALRAWIAKKRSKA